MPQRHAKAHVRLHRNSKCHVGEQLSFKSPRKRERKKERKNDLLFLNMLMFSSYSAASFQRAYHISQNRWKGLQNHRKTEVHISRCIIYLIQTSLLRMFVFWDIVAVNFRWTSWGRCGFCWSWPWNKQSKQHMNGT